MGKKQGVATQIKKDVQPFALSTHCYVQSLDLACGDWIRNSTALSRSLDTYKITTLIKFSPKRNSHLRKLARQLEQAQ